MLTRLRTRLAALREAARLREELAESRRRLESEKHRADDLESRLRDANSLDRAVTSFHRHYYTLGAKGGTWRRTSWMGTPTQKNPLDMWIYQEILHETRPDLLLETGTADGGSALFFGQMFDLLGSGKVVSVDLTEVGYSGEPRPEHPRVRYLRGSSTEARVLEEVGKEAAGAERVMVVLDSDHTEGHVLGELEAYAPLVGVGQYLVVEDTNVNGNPVMPGFGPGPMEAVEKWLPGAEHFEVDGEREKLLFTFNPKGYLRRVR